MLCNGADKIAWFAVIFVTFVFIVEAELSEQRYKENTYRENQDSTNLDSNFQTESRKFFQTESAVESDLKNLKPNLKERPDKSSFPTKEDFFKTTSRKEIKNKGGTNIPVTFTTLDSELVDNGNTVQNDEYKVESDPNPNDEHEKHTDSVKQIQSDFYSSDESFQHQSIISQNKDEEDHVMDLYSDSELSGEFEQNESESSSSDTELFKEKTERPSIFSQTKTVEHLKDKQVKKPSKKAKKPYIHKDGIANIKKINRTIVKIKTPVKPAQFVVVKPHSNTKKPALANYFQTNRKQSHEIGQDQEQIPAAIDMAFQKPSIVTSPRPTQPCTRPIIVYSIMSQPATKPTKTYSKPTRIYTKAPVTRTGPTVQFHTKPTQALLLLTQTYRPPTRAVSNAKQPFRKPTKPFAKTLKKNPKKSYSRPTQTATKAVKSYSKATMMATKSAQSKVNTEPEQIFTRPGNSTLAQPTHWLHRHWSQQSKLTFRISY